MFFFGILLSHHCVTIWGDQTLCRCYAVEKKGNKSSMFKEFNFGLNERVGCCPAKQKRHKLTQRALRLLGWIMALIMRPCLVWLFWDVSALVWTLTGSVRWQSRPGRSHLSAFPLPATRPALSIHKLLLVKKKKKPSPSVYMRELMVILLSARATPSSQSCHKHSPNSLARRDKQLKLRQ